MSELLHRSWDATPELPPYLIEQLAELDAQVAEALTARHVGVDPIRRFSAEAGDVEALLVR